MLHVRRDEHDMPRLERPVLRTGPHPGLAPHHVVELVLPVGRLRIDAPCGQHINTRTHRSDAQKFEVRIALPATLGREALEILEIDVLSAHDPLRKATSITRGKSVQSTSTLLIAYIAAASLLTITPGLDTALVLRTAVARGVREAALAGAGVAAGCFGWATLVAFGLGALFAASAHAYAG